MKVKFNRDYKLSHKGAIYQAIGLGVGLCNEQPKSNYQTSKITLIVVFLCFEYRASLSYNYKPKKDK